MSKMASIEIDFNREDYKRAIKQIGNIERALFDANVRAQALIDSLEKLKRLTEELNDGNNTIAKEVLQTWPLAFSVHHPGEDGWKAGKVRRHTRSVKRNLPQTDKRSRNIDNRRSGKTIQHLKTEWRRRNSTTIKNLQSIQERWVIKWRKLSKNAWKNC